MRDVRFSSFLFQEKQNAYNIQPFPEITSLFPLFYRVFAPGRRTTYIFLGLRQSDNTSDRISPHSISMPLLFQPRPYTTSRRQTVSTPTNLFPVHFFDLRTRTPANATFLFEFILLICALILCRDIRNRRQQIDSETWQKDFFMSFQDFFHRFPSSKRGQNGQKQKKSKKNRKKT